jgi:hypothetical protein
MRKYIIHIITDEYEKIYIDVLIAPKIAVPFWNINQNISAFRYLHGLKLKAHLFTSDSYFEKSFLLEQVHIRKLFKIR